MNLRTTAILAICGVLASTAGAFAIPLPTTSTDARFRVESDGLPRFSTRGSRMTAGSTLLVDARLGHASLQRGARGETFLLASVTGSDAQSGTGAPPLNLAIVIDRSGSMKGERIANAMNAAALAVERMRDGDTVSVVSFDTEAEVVVPPTRIDRQSRASIEAAVRSIRLGGDTCISCGLDEGMRQLGLASLGGDRVSRMILLSDGAANAGVRDVGGLRALASRMRERGVTISTVGVDVDFDEKIMAAIANEANGRHYFVANASGLSSVFAKEFDDLLASIAKEAELSIELAPGVEVEEVFDRTSRREGNKLFVPFGTFSAKQEKTVLVKLRVPTDRDGSQPVADVKLAFRDLVEKTDGGCSGQLFLTVTSDGTAQTELDPFVAARLERSRTAQTLTEANDLFQAGRVDEARARLAERKADLATARSSAVALANASPSAAPPRAARPIDRDFADQASAVAQAEASFAPPPPSAAASAARTGKAQVRANQEAASGFGF